MRIESVRAHAFGPFIDRTLDLAPGMTIICGPNESGKSTWHAALYAALCGMRRGRGKPREEDANFVDRHRPWDAAKWEVSAIVRLEDGRRVELRHDLNGKVDCQARDVDLGRDYSSEIIYEGAPDGARWLGLDRRSFLETACVRQADIQSILDHADALQEHMQRAAATAGTDSTAAAALAVLDLFRRENVGQDRRNSQRPLRAAKDRFQAAQVQLEQAQGSHAEYVRQLEEVEKLEDEVNRAERDLQIVEAARARLEASQAQKRLERVRELSFKYPASPAPENQGEGTARAARLALDRWTNSPAHVDLIGPSAEELQNQLAEIPPMPDGDTTPHPDVVRAKDDYLLARSSLERHQRNRPPEAVQVNAVGLTPEEVRSISNELRLEEPAVDLLLQERVARAQERVDSFAEREPQIRESRKLSERPLLLRPFVGLARLITAIIRSLFGRKRGAEDSGARLQAMEELRNAESKLGDVRFQISDVRRRMEAAKTKASAHALPDEPAALSALALRLEQAAQAALNLSRWGDQENELKEEARRTEVVVVEALRTRGVIDPQPVAAALEDYVDACKERDRETREAARRTQLESAYESRKRQEVIAADSERRRKEAITSLQKAVEGLASQSANDEETAIHVQEWLDAYDRSADDRRRAAQEWEELQNLLGEGSIQDLEEVAAQKNRTAEEFAQGLDIQEVAEVVLEDDIEAQLRGLEQQRSDRREALADKRARLDEYARTVPSVAEAEEEVARGEAELERVTGLDRVLTMTQGFLEQAQDKVHRTLAPLLRDALKPWLQAVTGGRYSDVTVDVETLMVQVSGGGSSWRNAALLSHGTAEQIYLLLRVAMARLLTRQGEVCPLLFDDVTVHCDPVRQNEILSILHAVSRDQQVILFSQEPETLAWAKEHLSEERDRLIELDPSGIPA
ncbi:MAG: AAA family ATPase [Dehalococcoidia bacterium]|nr:AAA family ATPase [Dehalococcoidia bacterium]